MKTTQIIFGVLFVLFMSSCIKRGQPIEEQVVYYMENFDEDKYTKYKLSNGDIVYYPNEILKIVDHKELSQFDTNHYKRVKIKNKTYYLPKNRAVIQRVQMIRKNSKIKTLNAQKKKETTPNSKDELDIITVGQPHTITSPEEVESTLPKNSDPTEQLAH